MPKSTQARKGEFYLQGTEIAKEGFHDDTPINFEWNIIYSCNFRCPHCIFDGKWEEYGKRTVFLSVYEWVNHWKNIYKLYGRSAILVTGGEPFLYPYFIDIIREISKYHHPIHISTNGSGNINTFIETIDPKKVSLNISFQPGFNKLDDVIEKNKLLRSAGFNTTFINLCAYPPYLKIMRESIEKTNRMGEVLKVIPFYGMYNNISYPDAYTEKEREMLGINKVWEKNVKRKGKMCKAGFNSALIFPDGKVARCGQIGERFPLGNIFAGDFKLLKEPMTCDTDLCPCLEGELAE